MEPRARELLNELYVLESKRDYLMSTPEAVVVKLLPYRSKKTEHFLVILVDNKNHFMCQKVIFKGTVDQAAVFPREVFRYALLKQASGLILAHNHPGGDPTPSNQDRQLTSTIKQGASLLGLRLLDHIIVARHGHYSFTDNFIL